MTRRLLPLSLKVLLLLATVPSLHAQEAAGSGIRIASINVDLVVAEASEGKELREFLQQIEAQTRAGLEANASRIEGLRQSAAGKGPDELRGIQHQIEDLQRQSQRLADDAERRAAKQQEEILRQINERLRPIVQQLIDEGGYELVLNASIGGVLHASQRVDLTQRVIGMLQAQEEQPAATEQP